MPLKDNSTLLLKAGLRRKVQQAAPDALVMETHGGFGRMFERVWHASPPGVVVEKDKRKAEFLAEQRPHWSVYQADCERALRDGFMRERRIGVLDVDPYGSPFETIAHFLASREPVPLLHVVVNDGCRRAAQKNLAWKFIPAMRPAVEKYGNAALYHMYLQVCREVLTEMAAQASYDVAHFEGYYCGYAKCVTHYWATFQLRV